MLAGPVFTELHVSSNFLKYSRGDKSGRWWLIPREGRGRREKRAHRQLLSCPLDFSLVCITGCRGNGSGLRHWLASAFHPYTCDSSQVNRWDKKLAAIDPSPTSPARIKWPGGFPETKHSREKTNDTEYAQAAEICKSTTAENWLTQRYYSFL